MSKIIAYYRVSTKRQGQSGLGLEGQKAAVEGYAKAHGCKLLAAYTEVESGKISERPQLAKALAHAKSAKAILVVAKLDRLSRNLAFLSSLMEAGVEFTACDNPHANRLTIHILAAIAEHEAKMISERTKTALAAAKVRGKKLGSSRPGHWEGREDRRLAGARAGTVAAATARRNAATIENAMVLEIITKMRAEKNTWQSISDELNIQGHVTRRGNIWTPAGVCQLARTK